MAAFALTEPDAGSDARAIELTADADPETGGYRLTGEKLWISNAPEADIYTVFARAPRGGMTAFAIPGDHADRRAQGDARPACDRLTHFRRRPGRRRTATRPGGRRVPGRDAHARPVPPVASARSRSGWRGQALDLVTAHALQRHTFGKPLKDHQAVAHRLADLEARTQAARLLVHQAARAHDDEIHDPSLAAMAKLLATEIAQEAVDAAIQFHGALALEHGHPLEHLYREVRAPRIYEGAYEIQREIIARAMFRAAEGRASSPPGPPET